MVKNKKSFIKIVEALFAIVLLFLFLMYFINISNYQQKQNVENENGYLIQFEDNQEFRECVYSYNTSCLDNYINNVIPSAYGFDIIISESPNSLSDNLPTDKIVKSESMIIAQNQISGTASSLIVRLYLWEK